MKKILYWLPVLFVACIIFYLSTIPTNGPQLFKNSDKVYHFIAYSVFAFFMMGGFSHSLKKRHAVLIELSVVIVALYGIFLEIYQSFLPTREMSSLDVVANTLGALFGSWFYLKFREIFVKHFRRRVEA